MITLTVTYIVGDQTFERRETFVAPSISPIKRYGTNGATLRAAINDASAPHRDVLEAVYRELVLANYARFDGKSGISAEPALSSAFPDRQVLPGFIRTSARFNAAGMIFYNAKTFERAGSNWKLVPSLLHALIQDSALENPRCPLPRFSEWSFSFSEEVNATSTVEGAVTPNRRIRVSVQILTH